MQYGLYGMLTMVVGNCRLHGENINKYFVEIVVGGYNSTTTFY